MAYGLQFIKVTAKATDRFKGRIGMETTYNKASNAWDAIRNANVIPFHAENSGVFQENILGPEVDKNLIEIMDSLDKGGESETQGETEMHLGNDSEIPKHSSKNGEVSTEDDQAWVGNAILTAQNELNDLLDQMEPQRPTPKEQTSQTDVIPSAPSYVSDLLNDTKHQLTDMKAFAAFAKDKFRDPEVGIRYQKAFLRRIDKIMILLNSYADYLSLSNPARKTNTINRLFEEVLTKHTEQLGNQQIEIIKKQFADDLPETTVPEAQLEYILASLMEYIIHSASPRGSLGLLTRLVDDPKRSGEEDDPLQEGQKYVEILFVFSTHDKKSDLPSSSLRGQGMELILHLVQEIIEKNKGFMEVKPSGKNAMTFISLRLPVERRTVLEFKPLR
jgi:hypothetical protein